MQINIGKKPVRIEKKKRHLFTKAENQHLSIFSLAFLFRLKLAKNKKIEENLNIGEYLKKMEESDSNATVHLEFQNYYK